jgi:membrane protein
MGSWKDRIRGRVAALRQRRPWFDHALSTVSHYGAVRGNTQAGAVTFYAFLSFFPILALAFFVVGLVAHVYPDLRGDVRGAIDQLLPHVIGNKRGQIPMRTFEDAAGTLGVVGLAGVLYSGLGWISGMREALEVMFVVPKREQPGLVRAKALDLGTLLVIGVILLLSVTLSAAMAGFSSAILRWVGIDPGSLVAQVLLWLVLHTLAMAATTVLLMAMFKLLVEPHVPRRSLLQGAVLGAVGFELLKMLAAFLLGQTRSEPAFQAFGVALIVVVWIHYFSRLVMLSAAYAYTSPPAVRQRVAETTRAPGAALAESGTEPGTGEAGGRGPTAVAATAAGAAGAALAGAVLLRRRKD